MSSEASSPTEVSRRKRVTCTSTPSSALIRACASRAIRESIPRAWMERSAVRGAPEISVSSRTTWSVTRSMAGPGARLSSTTSGGSA